MKKLVMLVAVLGLSTTLMHAQDAVKPVKHGKKHKVEAKAAVIKPDAKPAPAAKMETPNAAAKTKK